jgi:hypothetical protein
MLCRIRSDKFHTDGPKNGRRRVVPRVEFQENYIDTINTITMITHSIFEHMLDACMKLDDYIDPISIAYPSFTERTSRHYNRSIMNRGILIAHPSITHCLLETNGRLFVKVFRVEHI